MVSAGEIAGVAGIGAHNPVAPVPAHIQESPQIAPPVAAQNHRLLAHIGMEKVVGLGNQRLMPEHQPGPPEHLFLFLGVYVRVNENAPVKLPGFHIYDSIFSAGR